jgi:hypothetical protein
LSIAFIVRKSSSKRGLEKFAVLGPPLFERAVVGGGDLDVEAELAPRLDEELVAKQTLGRGVVRVEGEQKRLAGLGFDAAGVASLAEQLPSTGQIHVPVGISVRGVVSEDSRRERRLGGDTPPVQEQTCVLLRVDDEAHRLSELAGARARLAADHGVVHVEAEVVDGGNDRLLEPNPQHLHLGGQTVLPDHLVEALTDHTGRVVVALQELVKRRDRLLLASELDPLDEGQRPPGEPRRDPAGLEVA